LFLAVVALRALMNLQLPLTVPIRLDLNPDATVLAFTVLVSLAAGVIFGLVPALQALRMDMAPTLKDESTGRGGARDCGTRSWPGKWPYRSWCS
jgi:hypothetical protein